jgi:hypothetical protein
VICKLSDYFTELEIIDLIHKYRVLGSNGRKTNAVLRKLSDYFTELETIDLIHKYRVLGSNGRNQCRNSLQNYALSNQTRRSPYQENNNYYSRL